MAKTKSKASPPRARRWVKRIFLFFLGFVIGFHLYAIALKWVPVPGTILMIQRGVSGEDVRRNAKGLEDISPHLVRAVIAAEDTGFCTHKGVDGEAIKKALDERAAGKKLRGASTITQQTAKNVFFWNGGGLARKGGEAWMATVIDTVWGKRRVMEVYLNVAEWGDGIFGAEAAAQARFGKSAAALTEREAALLAAVLPSPNKWRLDPAGPYVNKRAGTLQARMRTVRAQGLDACVLEAGADGVRPAPPKPVVKKAVPAPVPESEQPEAPMVDLPIDDATPTAVDAETGDALDAVLDAADDALDELSSPMPEPLSEPAPEPMPEMGPEFLEQNGYVLDTPEPEPEPTPSGQPLELRPVEP